MEQEILTIVKSISGRSDIDLDTELMEVGLDSTNIIEILIEAEMVFNVDALDNQLNLDQFKRVRDIGDYLSQLVNRVS